MTAHSRPSTLPVLAALLAVSSVALPLLALSLHPQRYASSRSDQTRALAQNSSSLARIFGEMRTSVSDMMFMKTEIYLHSGVGYAPHLDTGAMASSGAIQNVQSKAALAEAMDSAHVSEIERDVRGKDIAPGQTKYDEDVEDPNKLGIAEAPTLVLSPLEDFRGILGDLEREVKPWRDPRLPHKHTSGEELLPWYRLMTLSDPTNVRGYMIGSWWLFTRRTEKDLKEALKFVEEGIVNNPEAFQLYLMKGRIHDRIGEPTEALAAWRTAARLALAQRPRDGVGDTWTDYLEDDCRAAARFEILTLRDAGRIAEAVTAAKAFLAVIPEDAPSAHFLQEVEEGKYREGIPRPPDSDEEMGPQK